MLPNQVETRALPPPPGIIGSLRVGFDAIAAHIGLILMPLGLDLLLWLGPRLSISKLMQPLLDEMARIAPASGLPQADIDSMMALYREVLTRLNLLAALRTIPVGVSSLMSGRMPILSPLGPQAVLQVDSLPQLLGLLMILSVIGWSLGGVYFQQVARLISARSTSSSPSPAGRAVVQTVLYSLICAAVIWSIGLPALFVVYLSLAINPVLGQAVLLFIGFLALWLIVPLFFSPHGIYVNGQTAFASFLGGFRLARFTLPTSSLFVLTIFLVGMGLNSLWIVPAEETWVVLVGLLGHAFITTALLAASFVYYQDMSAWVQNVLERLRSGLPTQAA
jgi:hypothetical protein